MHLLICFSCQFLKHWLKKSSTGLSFSLPLRSHLTCRHLCWLMIFQPPSLQWPKPSCNFLLEFLGYSSKIFVADIEANTGNKWNCLKPHCALHTGSAEVKLLVCHCKALKTDVPMYRLEGAVCGFWPNFLVKWVGGGEVRSWCRELLCA